MMTTPAMMQTATMIQTHQGTFFRTFEATLLFILSLIGLRLFLMRSLPLVLIFEKVDVEFLSKFVVELSTTFDDLFNTLLAAFFTTLVTADFALDPKEAEEVLLSVEFSFASEFDNIDTRITRRRKYS